jgi:cytochrome P450
MNRGVFMDDGWREMIRAVVRKAGDDARHGKPDAFLWLQEPETLDTFVTVAGIDTRAVVQLARKAEQRVTKKRAKEILREIRKWKKAG